MDQFEGIGKTLVAADHQTNYHGNKYDIKLWVRHLTGIMDALGIDKASFVGNSFGGARSVGLALFDKAREFLQPVTSFIGQPS